MSPLTEPDLKISLIRLFRSTSSTDSGIQRVIYLRLREWIILEKTIELIPVVAFLLAATIDPFKGEFHDMIVEVLHPTEVTTHSIVVIVSDQLLSQ